MIHESGEMRLSNISASSYQKQLILGSIKPEENTNK